MLCHDFAAKNVFLVLALLCVSNLGKNTTLNLKIASKKKMFSSPYLTIDVPFTLNSKPTPGGREFSEKAVAPDWAKNPVLTVCNNTSDSNDIESTSCLGGNKWTIEYLHRFMFHPTVCTYLDKHEEYIEPYQLIRPDDNQAAIARITSFDGKENANRCFQTKRCLLISHGNAGNIYNRVGLLDNLSHYPGDIICYEYDGFGLLEHKPISIQNCRENHLFWLKYLLTQGYQHIDLWGESIGGGIVMETLDYLRDNDTSSVPDGLVLPRIKQVYLQSTFSSIRNLLSGMDSVLYYLYSALFLNDLDTQSTISKFRGSPIGFNILHSRVDEVIPYSEAQTNYSECIKNRVSVKFWNIGGTHNQVIGLDTISF